MKKLQHAAAYLPYGIFAYNAEQESKIDRVIGIFQNTYDFENWSPINSNFDNYKLVLRPLSYLTKEIEINGETFVPIVKIREEETEFLWEEFENALGFRLEDFDNILDVEFTQENITDLPFYFVQTLASWHFKIFDDMKDDEWIDINTL